MRFLLIAMILAVSHLSQAQKGFQSGFLLTSKLDTVRGLLRFSGKAEIPSSCQFKSDAKSTPRDVMPGTIHGFCTDNGAYYFSRSVGKGADVFLEVLVRGHLNLFKFGNIYYAEKTDSAFFELSDEMDVIVSEGQPQKKKSRNYNRMLALIMSDCPDASKKASTITLKEKPLVSLIATYNTCKGSPSTYYRVKKSKRY